MEEIMLNWLRRRLRKDEFKIDDDMTIEYIVYEFMRLTDDWIRNYAMQEVMPIDRIESHHWAHILDQYPEMVKYFNMPKYITDDKLFDVLLANGELVEAASRQDVKYTKEQILQLIHVHPEKYSEYYPHHGDLHGIIVSIDDAILAVFQGPAKALTLKQWEWHDLIGISQSRWTAILKHRDMKEWFNCNPILYEYVKCGFSKEDLNFIILIHPGLLPYVNLQDISNETWTKLRELRADAILLEETVRELRAPEKETDGSLLFNCPPIRGDVVKCPGNDKGEDAPYLRPAFRIDEKILRKAIWAHKHHYGVDFDTDMDEVVARCIRIRDGNFVWENISDENVALYLGIITEYLKYRHTYTMSILSEFCKLDIKRIQYIKTKTNTW